MSKVRVYEVAKQLNMDQKALVALLQSIGISDVKNHMSAVDTDAVDRVRRHLEKSKSPAVVEERIRPTVVKRRSAPKAEASGAVPNAAPSGEYVSQEPPAPSRQSVEVPAARASTRDVHSEPVIPASRPSARVAREPVHEAPLSTGSTGPTGVTPVPPEARPSKPEPTVLAPVAPPAPSATQTPAPSVAIASAPSAVVAPAPSGAVAAPAKGEAVTAKATPAQPSVTVEPAVSVPEARPSSKVAKGDKGDKSEKAEKTDKVEKTEKTDGADGSVKADTRADKGDKSDKGDQPSHVEATKDPSVDIAPAPRAAASESRPVEGQSASNGKSEKVAKAEPAAEASPQKNEARPHAVEPASDKPAPLQASTVETTENSQKKPAPVPPPSPAVTRPTPAQAAPAPVAPPPSSPPASRPGDPPRTSAQGGSRPSAPPKTGVEVWAGRPGVPMPQASAAKPAAYARRTQVDPRAQGPARPGGPPGNRPQMRQGIGGNRPNGPGGRRQVMPRRPVVSSTKEMGADKKVIKIEGKVNLQTLAGKMSLKATEVLMKLLSLGMTGVNVNSALDADTAKLLAAEFGWEVEDVEVSEEDQLLAARGEETSNDEGSESRPPIVTVMGHVDHGKTSLLDQIRKTTVAASEAGGITQHIGAYRVQTSRGPVAFLDTPGHEAFTAMRARGASVTDIVILVVAADDGVMPQTREAISHARAAKCPIIVAINKIDKPEADSERIKRQLMELSLVPEELGGDTIFCEVSAKTRLGIEHLLEMVALQAEIMDLRASPEKPGHGTVVEALLDRGKGPVARVLVTDGTLRVGDYVLAGPAFGKIRAMTDDRGRSVTSAGPSTPVEVLGLSDVPNAGEQFDSVKDPKKAQELAEARRDKTKNAVPASHGKMTPAEYLQRADAANQLELRVILKADVQGSVEAVANALNRLSGEKVKLAIIQSAVGAITEGDVNLAIASKAIILGFNVRPAGKASQLADTEGVEIRQYSIIYNAVDDIRSVMEGKLAPTYIERLTGKAEIRQVFNLSKAGVIAGCMVTEGLIKRNLKARIKRGADEVFAGKITGLKRFKEDVKDVAEGFECGISFDDFDAMQPGDIIEAYDVEEVRQKLS